QSIDAPAPMIELLELLLTTLGSVCRSRKRLIPREPAPTPAASSRPPVPTPDPPSHPRQALLAARPPRLQELARPSPPGPARDCAALASPGLAPVLVLAVASSARAAPPSTRPA